VFDIDRYVDFHNGKSVELAAPGGCNHFEVIDMVRNPIWMLRQQAKTFREMTLKVSTQP
jgi:hypothetical protein